MALTLTRPTRLRGVHVGRDYQSHHLALYARFRSRQEHTFAEKMLSAMRFGFGGHLEVKSPLTLNQGQKIRSVTRLRSKLPSNTADDRPIPGCSKQRVWFCLRRGARPSQPIPLRMVIFGTPATRHSTTSRAPHQ
jgi:hypothetical protein